MLRTLARREPDVPARSRTGADVAAIDGKRSIGEILQGAVRLVGDGHVRSFIDQLWQCDQIVLDGRGTLTVLSDPN